MARPRVLVSSTCRDLRPIREQIKYLIEEMGYEAILSDFGDVYYSPYLHIHVACLNEVRNCDMVILVIGNQFGSESVVVEGKSVTGSEHDVAYAESIPIFCFIDEKVLSDYETYKNIIEREKDFERAKDLLSKIPFGCCKDYRIFKFIDNVRKKPQGNSYFPFKDFSDIRATLKKQWAGMVFDFLRDRRDRSSNEEIVSLLKQLEIANDKVEQIVDLLANDSLKGEESKKSLANINLETHERTIARILSEVWDGLDLDEAFFMHKRLISSQLEEIRRILFDSLETEPDEELSEYLRDIGAAEKDSFFIHFRVKYRIEELREANKRYKLKDEVLSKLITATLFEMAIRNRDLPKAHCRRAKDKRD